METAEVRRQWIAARMEALTPEFEACALAMDRIVEAQRRGLNAIVCRARDRKYREALLALTKARQAWDLRQTLDTLERQMAKRRASVESERLLVNARAREAKHAGGQSYLAQQAWGKNVVVNEGGPIRGRDHS